MFSLDVRYELPFSGRDLPKHGERWLKSRFWADPPESVKARVLWLSHPTYRWKNGNRVATLAVTVETSLLNEGLLSEPEFERGIAKLRDVLPGDIPVTVFRHRQKPLKVFGHRRSR